MLIFTFVMVSYFIVTAGVAYDVINEPPAIGGAQDPVTGESDCFMPPCFLVWQPTRGGQDRNK